MENILQLYSCKLLYLFLITLGGHEAYHHSFRTNQRIVANGEEQDHPHPSFPCSLNVTDESKMHLLKLISQKHKKFIHLSLNFTQEVRVFADYRDVLQLEKWMWVEKYAGKPLLELDFRFLAYSLYTLSHDVGWCTLHVSSEPANCMNRLDVEEKLSVVLLMMKTMIAQVNNTKLKSSACYSRIVPYPSSPNWYHIQYKCCDISMPGKYDTIMTDKYDHIGGDSDKTFITLLYVVLFLLSPLLISLLPEEPQLYKVRSDGSTARARYRTSFYVPKKPQHVFPACGSPDTNATSSPEDSVSDILHQGRVSTLQRNAHEVRNVNIMQVSVNSTISNESSISLPAPIASSEASSCNDYSPAVPGASNVPKPITRQSSTPASVITIPFMDETPVDNDDRKQCSSERDDKHTDRGDHDDDGKKSNCIHKAKIPKDTVIVLENNETSVTLAPARQTPSPTNSSTLRNRSQTNTLQNTAVAAGSTPQTAGSSEDFTLYIALDRSTPVRLSHPFRYLFLLHINNEWVCRFRRVNFFLFLYPFIVHVMVTVDIMLYYTEVQFLNKVEKDMGIEGKLTDLDLFDYFWLGNIFTSPPLIVFSVEMFMYFVMTVILAVEGNLPKILSQLMVNTNSLGYINLPPSLHTTQTEARGFHLLYHKMKFRLTLMAEPKFWAHWFCELKVIFKKCCSKPSPLHLLKLPMDILLHVFSLLLLFPLFNCFPWYVITCQMADVSQSAEAAQRCMKRYHHKRLSKLLCIVLIVQIIGVGLIFALKVFMKMCKIITLFVLYTIKGIVKHYMHTLPAISVLAVSFYYFISTTNKLENKYLEAKKMIFDECILRHEELEESGKYKNCKASPLVIFRKDGIPLIPQKLYELIINKHLPLKDNELTAMAKLCLIATFLVYVATTINAFSITNTTSVGQALATFCAVTLPKMFDCFSSRNSIDDSVLRYKVQTTIWDFYDELMAANMIATEVDQTEENED